MNLKNEKLIEKFLTKRKSNNKAERTIEYERLNLLKFDRFLSGKNFEDVTDGDLQRFFNGLNSWHTRDRYGTLLIQFFRGVFDLDKKERPKNMKWFEYTTKKQKKRQKNPNKKDFLIEPEEYKKLLDVSVDEWGMWKALWETYYLSGGRLSEIQNMKIKDVGIEENGVTVTVIESKTIPRDIFLQEEPKQLLRWLGNHPFKDDPDAPLWLSSSRNSYMKQISDKSICRKFRQCKNLAKIKKPLTVHCFRKTRATMMFNSVSKDGGHIFDNKEIAEFFGWEANTVLQRMEEYDLRTSEDLKKKIFGLRPQTIETFDDLKRGKEKLEKKQKKEIELLKKKVSKLTSEEHFANQAKEDIEKLYQKKFSELEKLYSDKYNEILDEMKRKK